MKTKHFLGYLIIGANTRDDAENERGLLLWSDTKPSWYRRVAARILGVYWIDKPKMMSVKEAPNNSMQDSNQETQLYKVRHPRRNKTLPITNLHP